MRFLIKNEIWLELEFTNSILKENIVLNLPSISSGKPRKLFLKLSDRS